MELISKLTVTGAANIDIGFNPYTFYTQNNNYMKIELAHNFLRQASSSAGYLYATITNWFSFESGRYGSYFNFADTVGVIRTNELPNITTTNGVTNPITIVFNNGSATATQDTHTATRTYSGSMPNDTVRFYRTSASEDYSGEFYGFKVYGDGDVLAHHYVGFDDGVNVGIEDLVTGDKYTPTGSNYTIVCEEYTPPTPTSDSKIYLGANNLGTGKIRLGANDVSAIYLGTSLLYPPTTPPTPTITFVKSITEDADYTQSQWDYTHCIDTGVPHTTSTTTVRIKYTPKDTYSNRIVGYCPSDSGCSGDNNDFRIFSYSGGSFDYKTSRASSLGVFNQNTYYDLTIGDNFVYDNINETYLYQGSTVGSVPSQGCHIFVDVSTLYVDEVIIMDGNTTLFEGYAAYDSLGRVGLYDTVSDSMKYNSNLTMTYEEYQDNEFAIQSINGTGSVTVPAGVKYSMDKTTWSDGASSTTLSNLAVGEKVYCKTVACDGSWPSGASFVIQSGNYMKVSGKLGYLLFGNTTDDQLMTTAASGVFYNCSGLVDASDLEFNVDMSNITQSAFADFFNRCTSLTAAPVLPYTTLTRDCYSLMFYGCSSLVTAPTLPATIMAYGCYNCMFKDCTSLVTPPALPATTLANYCYDQMFKGCISLTSVPTLQATTLANYCYREMFSGCTSLTTGPSLPATSIPTYAYNMMFYDCTSLNSITTYADTWSETNALSWMYNVAASGTFTKPANTTIPTGVSGIPTGWTVVDAQ